MLWLEKLRVDRENVNLKAVVGKPEFKRNYCITGITYKTIMQNNIQQKIFKIIQNTG
jgi:hypothetical protein